MFPLKIFICSQVSPEHVQQWCENLGAEYFECSAKEDIDVDMEECIYWGFFNMQFCKLLDPSTSSIEFI